MSCSLTCGLVAAASNSISEAVQLESPTTPAQHWHFHGVTALKFAEGRWQTGPEGCEGSIVRELAPSHAAQHFGCSDADRSHQVQERPSLKEHNEASACKKPSCNILKSLVLGCRFGTGSFGVAAGCLLSGSRPGVTEATIDVPVGQYPERIIAGKQQASCYVVIFLGCQSIVSLDGLLACRCSLHGIS